MPNTDRQHMLNWAKGKVTTATTFDFKAIKYVVTGANEVRTSVLVNFLL